MPGSSRITVTYRDLEVTYSSRRVPWIKTLKGACLPFGEIKLKRVAILTAIASCAVAHGQYTSIDLSSYTNYLTTQQTDGGNYPDAGFSYTDGGIPFTASAFDGDAPEGLIYLGPITGLDTVDIAVDESGLQSIYTEINSAYGASGTQPGTVELVGSAGTVTYDLIEGLNIRDHYYGDFTNTVEPGIGGTVYWSNGVPIQVSAGNADSQYIGDVRNDVQGWVVPSNIGELLSVDITYTNTNYSYGEPLVYGLTTSTAPLSIASGTGVPGPEAVISFACFAVGTRLRRRRNRA